MATGVWKAEIKALAAVVLRRALTSNIPKPGEEGVQVALWTVLTLQGKAYLKDNLLQAIHAAEKDLAHKLSNLLVEMAGAIYEHEGETIWQDLLNLVFQFTNSQSHVQVEAALNILTGLQEYIPDHLNKHQSDLKGIFERTLRHESLDIRLASLRATAEYLNTVESKDTKAFEALVPDMLGVLVRANQEDDEAVLDEGFIEFIELAEQEPKFFRKAFKEIYQ